MFGDLGLASENENERMRRQVPAACVSNCIDTSAGPLMRGEPAPRRCND